MIEKLTEYLIITNTPPPNCKPNSLSNKYKSCASHPNHFLFHTITTIIPTHLHPKTPARLRDTCSDGFRPGGYAWTRRGARVNRDIRGAGSRARLRSVHAPPASITSGVVGEERVVVGGWRREVAWRKRDRRVGRAPRGAAWRHEGRININGAIPSTPVLDYERDTDPFSTGWPPRPLTTRWRARRPRRHRRPRRARGGRGQLSRGCSVGPPRSIDPSIEQLRNIVRANIFTPPFFSPPPTRRARVRVIHLDECCGKRFENVWKRWWDRKFSDWISSRRQTRKQ